MVSIHKNEHSAKFITTQIVITSYVHQTIKIYIKSLIRQLTPWRPLTLKDGACSTVHCGRRTDYAA